MWVWVDRLGGLLIDAGVSALALWGVILVAMLGCRQPARRLRLARAAAIGSLAVLPLIGLKLVPRFDLLATFDDAGLWPRPVVAGRTLIESNPLVWLTIDPIHMVWPLRWLTLFYLSGVALELGRLALGCAGLAWLIRKSREPSAETLAFYGEIPFPADLTRPRLRLESRTRRPVLVGAWRPSILIPLELDQPSCRDQLRLSLLHELAHAEAHDPWFTLVGQLAQAFWFFVPPLWWVMPQVRLDQEYLADRRAAQRYGPVRSYASSLLDIASTHAAESHGEEEVSSEPTVGRSPLFQRVLMLLRCPFPVESRPLGWWSWGLPILIGVVTLLVSSLSLRLPHAHARGRGHAASHTFQLSRLELCPAPAGPLGRCVKTDLPIRLPSQFELVVEIWGDLDSLTRVRLAGIPIVSPTPAIDLFTPASVPGWHLIKLLRDPHHISLWIDGRPVPAVAQNTPLTRWLSFEPAPNEPASLQRLALSWQ